MLKTLASVQVRCSANSWNQPCNFSCIFNRFFLLLTNLRCSKSTSSLSMMDGKMQEHIKCPSPSCLISQLRALILSGVVPIISGFQEKNIIICCLSTAVLVLLCLLLSGGARRMCPQSRDQGSSHWDGAGSGQSWCSYPSACSNICSSSQERAPLKLIKGRGKKWKWGKKSAKREKLSMIF